MAGKELWMSVGIPNSRIFEGLYMLDDFRLFRCYDDHDKLNALKSRLNVEHRFVYLFVGNFIPSRNALLLLEAYKRIATDETAIIMVGRGEQYEDICTFAHDNAGMNIHVIPGVPFDELHYYYAIANAYVHPGREPYSLALQEAAIMGIPIVSTREVGAAWDYLEDQKNGLIIDYNDVDQLSFALLNIRNIIVSHDVLQMCKQRNIDYAVSQAKAMIQSVQSS
jgi:glycosyltransferase involved in cell wall biosynthesis